MADRHLTGNRVGHDARDKVRRNPAWTLRLQHGLLLDDAHDASDACGHDRATALAVFLGLVPDVSEPSIL